MQVLPDEQQAHQVPQLLAVQEQVLSLLEIPVVVRKAPLVVVHQTQLLAVPRAKAVESVCSLVASLEELPEQLASQPGKRQLAMRQEQPQVASRRRAQQQVQLVPERPEPRLEQQVLQRSE